MPPLPSPDPSPPPGYGRARRRDEQARAALRPLAPGERPRSVTLAALVAAALALANLAGLAAGVEVSGRRPGAATVAVFAALMLAVSAGMWRGRYWAVLGFEAMLAVSLIIAGLSLVVASNVAAVALCLAVLGLGGALFWKLVRAMARIQIPRAPGPS